MARIRNHLLAGALALALSYDDALGAAFDVAPDGASIHMQGPIVAGDHKRLLKALTAVTPRMLASNNNRLVIWLASEGGDWREGLRMAMTLVKTSERVKLGTGVLWDQTCASSCVSLFAAGSMKLVGRAGDHDGAWWGQGKLYVHSVVSSLAGRQGTGIEDDSAKASTVAWARVLKAMGAPDGVLTKLVTTRSREGAELSVDDLNAWGVVWASPEVTR